MICGQRNFKFQSSVGLVSLELKAATSQAEETLGQHSVSCCCLSPRVPHQLHLPVTVTDRKCGVKMQFRLLIWFTLQPHECRVSVVRVWHRGGKEEEGQLEVAQMPTVAWPSCVTGHGFCVHPSFIHCCIKACDSGCLWAQTEWECAE